MKHAGKYGCRAQTSADTVFSEAELLVRGDLISQSDVLYFLKLNQFSKLECFRRISKTISQFVTRAADFLGSCLLWVVNYIRLWKFAPVGDS